MSSPDPVSLYRIASHQIVLSGFGAEVCWQSTRDLNLFSESDLLRETAWVILCCGFKEATVRRYFPFISACFLDWESASAICESAQLCRVTALSGFKNEQKINAIVNAAAHVHSVGFASFRKEILGEPLTALRRLPFIGKITAYHLAKNLGAKTAKPDRHLSRLALSLGFTHPQELCLYIAKETGDPVCVIDIVLWRYLEQGYTSSFPPTAGGAETHGVP